MSFEACMCHLGSKMNGWWMKINYVNIKMSDQCEKKLKEWFRYEYMKNMWMNSEKKEKTKKVLAGQWWWDSEKEEKFK